MSFKIFFLQLRGKIKPVSVVEKRRELLLRDFNEFKEVEKSEELTNFLELEKWVNSEEFKKKKAEIEALAFKGSRQFNQLKEFDRLSKSKKIRKYFKAIESIDLKRYQDLKDSEKLSKYYNLLSFVKDGELEKEREKANSETFKGSVEEKKHNDFKTLGKSAGIKACLALNNSEKLKKHEELANSQKLKKFLSLRNTPEKSKEQQKEFKELKRDLGLKSYFKFEKSKKLRLFRETEGSHDLKKYYELKSYLESEEYKSRVAFLKDKKKFEKTEAFKKYQEFKKLAADTDVKFVLKYEKSSIFKNYLDVKESFDLKRYLELKTITTSKEFLERKAYLEDKKKWEKTEDFAKQQAYLEQKKLPHLVNYFKYKGTTAFDFFNQWEVVFEDDFSAATLDSKKWTTQSYWAEKLLGENYSMPGDLHAFTNGENVKTNGKLTLEVRKEKKKGKIWKMPAGFIPVEFDFTSALISTGNSFWMEDGILEAKIYFNPVKEVVSSFYLSGEKNMPRVNLLEMGTKNRLGISTVNKAGKMQVNGLDISNLKKGISYIFSIQKKGTSFTWKINETEVLRIENSEVNFPLHLNASSIVVFEVPGSKLPVRFQIDRIKCYRKK